MSRPALRPLSLLSLLAVLSALAAGCGGGSQPTAPPTEATAPEGAGEDAAGNEAESAEHDTTLEPLPRRTVEIYFPSMVEDGLVSESREIFSTATPGDQVKQIVSDLLSGPAGEEAGRAVPGGTRLRQVYVLDDGTAWLDFTSELADGMGGGSMNELLTVYAIIDSVVANVTEVRRVGILIDGQPVETLNGHMHLRKPLRPDFSLVLDATTVQGPSDGDPDRLTENVQAGAVAD